MHIMPSPPPPLSSLLLLPFFPHYPYPPPVAKSCYLPQSLLTLFTLLPKLHLSYLSLVFLYYRLLLQQIIVLRERERSQK